MKDEKIQQYLKWQHEKDRELMRTYVNSHPEMESFINACAEIQKASQEGKRAVMNINVGRTRDDGFHMYLANELHNPIVAFDSYQEKNGDRFPQIIITANSPVTEIAVNDIKSISFDTDADDKCNKYYFVLNYVDNLDYCILVMVYKNKFDID